MATGNNSTYNKGSQSNTRSKTTASRSTSTARSPQKARSSQSSRQASASRTGGRKTKAQLAQEQARKNEIHLFICLAVCTFFFISNFGWCGVVGNFFAKFMFGLFGVVEYVLPLYIFLTEAFLLSNGAKKAVVNRVLCVGLFIVAAAFIFQLTAGADHMTAKLLYDQGAQEKKGGGFILGGLLVVLYNLIGKPGAIIVIALLIIIGIIVVMNVSLIDFAKERSAQFKNRYNALYEDDDEEAIDPEAALEAKRRTKLDNIKVEQEKPAVPVKKKKKKVKNKKVEGEEVHELKPLPHEDLFNPNLTLQDAKDVSEGYVDLSLLKKKKGGVTELRSAKADIHLCRIHRRKRRWISLTAQIMQTEPHRRKRQSQIRCGRRKTHRQVLIFLLMMRRLRIHWNRYIRRERRVQQKNRWTPQMFPCRMRTRLQ